MIKKYNEWVSLGFKYTSNMFGLVTSLYSHTPLLSTLISYFSKYTVLFNYSLIILYWMSKQIVFKNWVHLYLIYLLTVNEKEFHCRNHFKRKILLKYNGCENIDLSFDAIRLYDMCLYTVLLHQLQISNLCFMSH